MQSRMNSPAMIVPEAMPALQSLGQALFASADQSDLPRKTLFLAYLRTSQINGDSVCVDLHSRNALNAGAATEQVVAVSAWRESTQFSDGERAALALAEAMARIPDQSDPVPDATYDEAARHYGEQALATLIAGIATAHMWNRFNVATRQIASPAPR